MTSSGNWISSHHSRDEAVAACRVWFKCSPIIRQLKDHKKSQAPRFPFLTMIKAHMRTLVIALYEINKKAAERYQLEKLNKVRH